MRIWRSSATMDRGCLPENVTRPMTTEPSTLRCLTLCWCTTLHHTVLYLTARYNAVLPVQHHLILHCIIPPSVRFCNALNCTLDNTLLRTTLCYAILHYTTLPYIALQCTTLCYIPLHNTTPYCTFPPWANAMSLACCMSMAMSSSGE